MSIKSLSWAWVQNVKGNQKLVLLALADHADDEGRCWPGLEGLSAKCHLSRSSIISHIQDLAKAGLVTIQKRYNERGRRQSNIYILNLNLPLSPDLLHSDLLRSKFPRLSPDSGPLYIEPSIEPSNKNICRIACRTSEIATDSQLNNQALQVQGIFDYWRHTLNHPRAILDQKRKSKIVQALKNYTIEELKTAIDGCKASSFHQGNNSESKTYDDIELVFRDSKHIEQFIQLSKKTEAGNLTATAPTGSLAKTLEGAL